MANENEQSYVQAPVDGAGKRLDARRFTITSGSFVYREVMAVGGTTVGAIAAVLSELPPSGAPGLTVRQPLNPSLYSQLPKALGQNSAASSLTVVLAPRPVVVQSPTAASFSVVLPGAKNVLSSTAASFNVTVSGSVTTLGAKNVLSATAASFLVLPYAPSSSTLGTSLQVISTNPVVLFAAPGAGLRNHITSMVGSNESLATNVELDVFDRNTTGRKLFHAFLAFAGGGFSLTAPVAIRGNTNSTVVARVTSSLGPPGVIVSVRGYTGA